MPWSVSSENNPAWKSSRSGKHAPRNVTFTRTRLTDGRQQAREGRACAEIRAWLHRLPTTLTFWGSCGAKWLLMTTVSLMFWVIYRVRSGSIGFIFIHSWSKWIWIWVILKWFSENKIRVEVVAEVERAEGEPLSPNKRKQVSGQIRTQVNIGKCR